MQGRITYLLFLFTVGRIVVQTMCTSQKVFTCGKSTHSSIVITEGKVWPLISSDLYKGLFVFQIADHVLFFEGNFLLSFQNLFVHMQVIHIYDANTRMSCIRTAD